MQRDSGPSDPADAPSILPLLGLDLVVTKGERRILHHVTIEIGRAAGTLALMGPNGAGKSVLVRVLAGLIGPTAGKVTWAGRAPDRRLSPKIGFVFQRPVLLRRSAIANIEYALAIAGVKRAERTERARAALGMAGLTDLAQSPARVLSGGEQQRLSIARALATQPEVLILDEPTANLDPAASIAIECLVRAVASEGTSILIITHDVGQARRLADEVAFLHQGRLLERTPRNEFFAQPRSLEAHAFVRGDLVP